MLNIEMLGAGHGDCLWIEYGDPQALHRILIDGGPAGTYMRALRPKLRGLPVRDRRFELLIVTHIDADHIAGVLDLLHDGRMDFRAADIWFNGYRHLPDESPETLGPVQGEKLTDLLVKPGVAWNAAFKKAAVVVPTAGDFPHIELEGGLGLTLLSPTPQKLADLKPAWEKEVCNAGLDPKREAPEEVVSSVEFELLGAPDVEALATEPFSEDTAEANGSSIAVLVEFEQRRVLLAGDAHPAVLTSAIKRLVPGRRLALDAFKLPHHGSKANLSRELLAAVDCKNYLFSTNGAQFQHPDRQAVARTIKWGGPEPQLTFNYRSDYNTVWDSKPLRKRYGYTTAFPHSDSDGIVLEWR